MKILVLDEEFPFPLNTGKRIRTFNLVARLAKRHQVSYLAYGANDSEGFRALSRAGINPVPVPHLLPPKSGPGFYLRLLANLFSFYPYIVTSHYSSIFQEKLDQIAAKDTFDVIVAEWTPYASFLQTIKGPKKVIVAHNIEYRIWERYYATEKNILKKWYIGRQLTKVKRFEINAFRMVDGVTAVSSLEAVDISKMAGGTVVQVVENGVDLDYFQPQSKKADGDSMIFVGSMNWRPNQDAIQYFVHEIFPLIKKARPSARAIFVGQEPPPFIARLNSLPGIEVVGKVDDVRPYVNGAAVYIVPLRIGGGTRLKILEAMAMKKGIVSTAVGAEGIEISAGRNILIANSPEDFASKVLRLMQEPEQRASLGEEGRKLVEDRYGWDIIAGELERMLLEISGKK